MSPGNQNSIKCFATKSKDGKLEPWQFEPQALGPDDIELRTTHNGLCHSDLHVWAQDWGENPFPLVPGHEIVGVVEQLGDSVSHLKKGDIVGVGWFRSACLECDACVRGDDNQCPNGVPTMMMGNHGGFAERFRCKGALAVKIPDGIPSEDAAPLLCAGVTVWTPISKYVTRPGMKVGIAGMGGLGHLALQFARAVGAEVYALSGSKSKEAESKKLGAHHFISLKDIADETLDLVLVTAPQGITPGAVLPKLAHNGIVVFLGGHNEPCDCTLMPVIMGEKSITGSLVGGRRMMREMFKIVALHNIKPMVEKFPLSDVNQAVEKLKSGDVRYRVVLETGDAFK